MKTTKTWKQKMKSVGLATIIGVAVASAGMGVSAAPASAHEYCDAEPVANYGDKGQIRQVGIRYTALSELGLAEDATGSLCQARIVADCGNGAGEVEYGIGVGDWTNGKSSPLTNPCPLKSPVIVGVGWQTAYDELIHPA